VLGEGHAEQLSGSAAGGLVAARLCGDGGEAADECAGAVGEQDAGAEDVDVCDGREVGLDVGTRAPDGEVGEGEVGVLQQNAEADARVEEGVEDGGVGRGEARGGIGRARLIGLGVVV